MNVSEAVAARKSSRAFKSDPVPEAMIRDLLTRAARAPSGGNLQPWHIEALTGEPLADLLALVEREGQDDEPGYDIYPANLWEPYRTRRFSNGEQLYATIPIAREDKAGRLRHMARNARFFDAPVGVFVLIERGMGPPQWSDLGMYIQTLLLLATEQGLASCPQEYWALYADKVERFLGVPAELQLFCGVALGYPDTSAPVNRLETTRAPTDEWLRLRGF